MSAIYILWLRQLKRYFRARIRIISSLGHPVLFLISLGFGFGPLYQRAGAGNYLQYLAPGVIAMGILFPGVFSGIEIIWDRQFGFLKETLVAPGFQLIMNFLVTPLFFFSNALFPVEGLPAPLKLLVHLNPLSYGIDGLRGAVCRALLFDQAIDFVVLGGVTAILLGVGSYLFSRIQL